MGGQLCMLVSETLQMGGIEKTLDRSRKTGVVMGKCGSCELG